jgi:acyl-[acyl-carrier-protein]-phospholipid O-acyltransferase/long-chain-fatty-acid--[acyl-carrier-protein] ligase
MAQSISPEVSMPEESASPAFQCLLGARSLASFNRGLLATTLCLMALALPAGQGLSPALALVLVFAASLLPQVGLGAWAGWAADRFPKRRVLLCARGLEALALASGLALVGSHPLPVLLALLLLAGMADLFFHTAQQGLLAELLPESELARGGARLESASFAALVLGVALSGLITKLHGPGPLWLLPVLLPCSAAALALCLGLPREQPGNQGLRFPLHPLSGLRRGLGFLWADRTLRVASLGPAWFHLAGGLLQMAALLWARQAMGLGDLRTALALALLFAGSGLGSLAAGQLSGDKVEIGLVPLGGALSGLAALLLPLAQGLPAAYLLLVLCGFGGGLFLAPLKALRLQRSPRLMQGRLAAAAGWLDAGAVILAGLLLLLLLRLGLDPALILALAGFSTLLGTLYLLLRVPAMAVRACLWWLTHTLYHTQVRGQRGVPFRGPVLMVCNHISSLDGLLVGAATQRFIRFTIARHEAEAQRLGWLYRLMKAIPIQDESPHARQAGIARIRAELEAGHAVCLFAEGTISRTGYLLPFSGALESILQGLPGVPVIPVCVEGMEGTFFGPPGRKPPLLRWPLRRPIRASVSFGKPLASPVGTAQARRAVLELAAQAAEQRIGEGDLLAWQFLRQARRCPWRLHMSDSSGRRLRFYQTLGASLALSRWVRRRCAGQGMVGVLMPATIPGALANLAIALAGKVPINLNFTAGQEAMRSAISQCGIQTVLTSPQVLEKMGLPQEEGYAYLEEAMAAVGKPGLLLGAAAALLLPAALLKRLYCPERQSPEGLATIIFSSGSTGVPKGVMLSHRNILANIRAMEQVIGITPQDRILGILPFFHSFGTTVTLWFPAVSGFGVAYHPSPTDAKPIGDLMRQERITIMVSTPTFYGHYLRKCDPADFQSLRFAVAGAEKLRQATASAFLERFGQPLYEGYGCTELSPVVAVNVPDVATPQGRQVGLRLGSVGHPLPGLVVRVVDPESGQELPSGNEGMVEVKGPTLMMGYLQQPEKTREVSRDGWYMTGDIGHLDDYGFLHLTDRLFRFSKIGGEMVPHLKVEEVLQAAFPEEGFGVAGAPDEAKGEHLVVLYTNPARAPQELAAALVASSLPKLWIPKREHFHLVEAIPTLGTGKTDLRELKRLALQRSGAKA